MLEHNQAMKKYLADQGIPGVMPKRLDKGSMRGTWRLYIKGGLWSIEIADKLNDLGFHDFDGKPLSRYSGNCGHWSIFAIAPAVL